MSEIAQALLIYTFGLAVGVAISITIIATILSGEDE